MKKFIIFCPLLIGILYSAAQSISAESDTVICGQFKDEVFVSLSGDTICVPPTIDTIYIPVPDTFYITDTLYMSIADIDDIEDEELATKNAYAKKAGKHGGKNKLRKKREKNSRPKKIKADRERITAGMVLEAVATPFMVLGSVTIELLKWTEKRLRPIKNILMGCECDEKDDKKNGSTKKKLKRNQRNNGVDKIKEKKKSHENCPSFKK